MVTRSGKSLYTRADIERGRQVWQSMGGMQLGSIWGHGGYVAPDWSADWLHREAAALLDVSARADGAWLRRTAGRQQAALRARLQPLMRANTYDAATGTITLDADRAAAISNVAAHYEACSATTRPARAARGVRDEEQHGARRRPSARAHRVLLVDGVGRGHANGRARTSPTPTTGRTSRWSATRRRRLRCGRSSACCS